MNEEEKKAIECLKNRLKILHNNTQWATENSIKVVLNLIEKQQKEIEDKQDYARLEKEQLLEDVKKYYISKDKIRKLIKDINEVNKNADEIEAVLNIKKLQVLLELLEE